MGIDYTAILMWGVQIDGSLTEDDLDGSEHIKVIRANAYERDSEVFVGIPESCCSGGDPTDKIAACNPEKWGKRVRDCCERHGVKMLGAPGWELFVKVW